MKLHYVGDVMKVLLSKKVSRSWISEYTNIAYSDLKRSHLPDSDIRALEELSRKISSGEIEADLIDSRRINYYDVLVELNKGVHPNLTWLAGKLKAPLSTVGSWRNGIWPSITYMRKLKRLVASVEDGTTKIGLGRRHKNVFTLTIKGAKKRACISCQKTFVSAGPNVRICRDCKDKETR